MEDEIGPVRNVVASASYDDSRAFCSIAVSLKRIADALTGDETKISPFAHEIWCALQDHATSRGGR